MSITTNVICLLSVLSIVHATRAQVPSRDFLKGYRKGITAGKHGVSLQNPGFQNRGKGWFLPDGYSIDPSGGRNGTIALKYERTNPKSYRLANQVVKLEPLKRYRFSAWIRTENLRGKESGGAVCLEFYKNGKYLRGSYPLGVTKSSDEWMQVVGETSVPAEADTCRLVLYLRPKMTGTVWFDDVEIRLAQDRWNAWVTSGYERVSKANASLSVSVYYTPAAVQSGDDDSFKCLVEASRGDFYACSLADVAVNRALAAFASLPEGEVNLKVSFIDTKRKCIYFQKEMAIDVVDEDTFSKKPILFNKNGSILVDGKPFLPVGIFTNPNCRHSRQPEEVLRKIAQGGFNCVLPYHSETFRLNWDDKPSVERLNEALDFCHELDLKIIFGIEKLYSDHSGNTYTWMGTRGLDDSIRRIVESFKNHPALLAWYISDENSNVEQVARQKRVVSRLDPGHPTYSVQYKYDVFTQFGGTSDIIGVDPYPVKSDSTHSMAQVSYAMCQANKLIGTPIWGVPQIFNWGPIQAKYLSGNKREEYVKAFRDPTEEEIRSMVLLMAIKGARGFIFWQYEELYRPPLTEDDLNRQWPKICRVARMLRDLSPFIVSDAEPKDVEIRTIKGDILAREFTDDRGRKRILIAAIGPGPAVGMLSLQTDEYKSLYGKTKNQGRGRYVFSSQNISSDILYVQE